MNLLFPQTAVNTLSTAAQAAGPFGGSKDIALTKTIEYYYGVKNDGTNGQDMTWTGTTVSAGTYISGVRTYTYKGAGPVYYDMVYTSNAHGQPEDTQFIDDDDSTTRTSTRLYTWRGRIRQIIHPDTNTIDYEWDDNLRLTAEKLDGDTEKYEYEYCLCGVVKRHKYTYEDSLSNSQTEVWTNSMDDVGRITKEYYPYPIYVDGADKEYHSILYDFDTASRRTKYSDPTFGHSCNDTSGWGDDTEPFDESDWADVEPQRYLYGMRGGLEATGRVAGNEIMAGEGEPYFVERDAAGRIAKVVYPDNNNDVPQLEWQYTYTDDGRLKQVAAVNTGLASNTTYGPQKYVVQFFHDDVGRLIRKVVRDNVKETGISTRYESKYKFDGRGQLTREQIIRYDESDGRMLVMSDTQTTYDLGRNPITIKRYDKWGWAFTETRTYARGYQLTGFSTSEAGDVTVTTSGSYAYDTNNNLLTTKKLDAHRTVDMTDYQISYNAEWTFTYDRKNRLKSHTNTAMAPVRGNLWYDGRGRVWQRWEDNSSTEDWDGTLLRFVYDGSQLAQEIEFLAYVPESEWVYTYTDLTRDYLRQPGGIRQREPADVEGYDDYYLQSNQGAIEYKVERGLELSTTEREERKTSLDQLPNTTFENISNLATANGYVEMYGGGTSGDTAGYDGLVQRDDRHYLAGLGREINVHLNGGGKNLGGVGGGGGPRNPQSPCGGGCDGGSSGFGDGSSHMPGPTPPGFRGSPFNHTSPPSQGSSAPEVPPDVSPRIPGQVNPTHDETHDPDCNTPGWDPMSEDDMPSGPDIVPFYVQCCAKKIADRGSKVYHNVSYPGGLTPIKGVQRIWSWGDFWWISVAGVQCYVACACRGKCVESWILLEGGCDGTAGTRWQDYLSRTLVCDFDKCKVEIIKLMWGDNAQCSALPDYITFHQECTNIKPQNRTFDCWYRDCPATLEGYTGPYI